MSVVGDWSNHHLMLGIVSLVSAVLVAALITPVVRHFAFRWGAVDAPGLRKVHDAQVARMGGVAIVLAYATALLLCSQLSLLEVPRSLEPRLLGFGAGAVIVIFIGLLDDIRGLRAWKKLAGQFLAATVVWSMGVRVNQTLVLPVLGPTDLGIIFSFVTTILWILLITNAINLIDGLDGLAGGVVFFAAVTNVLVAFLTDNQLAIALNASLAGAVLGFLFYNFNPAKIFMGDTGSLFLGYALSAGALMTVRQKESTLASLLVPLVALGLPLTDTLLAMTRRFLARKPIFSADREHLHHRLLDLGLTHRRAVLVLYGCSVTLCAVSVAAVLGKDWTVGAALLFALLVIIGIVRFAGSIQLAVRQREDRAHLYTPATLAAKRAIVALALTPGMDSEAALLARLGELLEPELFPRIVFQGADGMIQSLRDLEDQGQWRDVSIRTCHFDLSFNPETTEGAGYLELDCVVDSRMPPQLEVLLRLVADVVEGAARPVGRSG